MHPAMLVSASVDAHFFRFSRLPCPTADNAAPSKRHVQNLALAIRRVTSLSVMTTPYYIRFHVAQKPVLTGFRIQSGQLWRSGRVVAKLEVIGHKLAVGRPLTDAVELALIVRFPRWSYVSFRP